jgi:hypothetical protein
LSKANIIKWIKNWKLNTKMDLILGIVHILHCGFTFLILFYFYGL